MAELSLETLPFGETDVSGNRTEKRGAATFAGLSKDALTSIFKQCDSVTLRRVALVCQRFLAVVTADVLLQRRLAVPVFQDSGLTEVIMAFAPRFQPVLWLKTPSVSEWTDGRLEMYVAFRDCDTSSTMGCCVGETDHAGKGVQNALMYFSSGEVWCGAGNVIYPYDECAFANEDIVTVLLNLNVKSYADQMVVRLDADANCAVSFFRNETLVYTPLMRKFELDRLRVGVMLEAQGCAQSLPSASRK